MDCRQAEMHSMSWLDAFSSVLSYLRRWRDSPESCGAELVWCGRSRIEPAKLTVIKRHLKFAAVAAKNGK